ncbi:family 20 glycosylhydrolase [Dyella telluris]|uniref:N-acetyl-beta-glucosaminidase n=1 Tax=Dyella telluris TaxID=2763498 RepID=A0A7G8Q399_9GAMM|nr:family 20 glycosylhydrolase [Dyella telluris]QNK01257.1 beta-N-acetylhexosaminidase [Dyella telluris]
MWKSSVLLMGGLGLCLVAASGAAEEATSVARGVARANPAPLVMPSLRDWKGGEGRWTLGPHARLLIDPAHAEALKPVAARLAEDMQSLVGLKVTVSTGDQPGVQDIVMRLESCGGASSQIGREGYTLDIGTNVTVCANTGVGAFYAGRTLLQMLVLRDPAGREPLELPRGRAVDVPRYRERSVMMDVGRKFADVTFLQNYMRFMGWYKLNTLHLHLNDQVLSDDKKSWLSRDFRLKSDNPAFAKLVPVDGQYYTRKDWDALEQTAAANGVTIVPEIDTPGHSGAFVLARPDLAYPGDQPAGGTLDPSNPHALEYIESVFTEFLPWFRSSVIHVGGDEVNVNGGKVSLTAQIDYLNKLGRFLQQRGKQVEIWGSADMAAGLDKSFVIQRWINWGDEAKIDWSDRGFTWVESFGDWYVVTFGPAYFNPNGLHGDALYDGWAKHLPANTSVNHGPVGGQIAVWNDKGTLDYDYATTVNRLLKDAVPAAGQLFWSGQASDAAGKPLGYGALRQSVVRLQYGPDVHMFNDAPL